MDYSDLLKDPRWQKKRLEIMERDKFTCRFCGDTKTTLNVHHQYYISYAKPWEYSGELLVTLCQPCHKKEEDLKDKDEAIVNTLLSCGASRQTMLLLSEALFSYLYGSDNVVNDLKEIVNFVQAKDKLRHG